MISPKKFILLTCLLAVCSHSFAGSQVNFGTYYALLIANQSYDKRSSGFGKLNTPQKDVELIGGILKDKYGFEVKILKNQTRDQMYQEIEKLSSIPYDNVLVYFSGHGAQFNGSSYWIGTRAEEDDKENTTVGSKVNWLKINDVSDLVKRTGDNVQPKHVLIIADSCYASPHHVKGGEDEETLDLSQLESEDLLYEYYTRHSRNFFSSGSLEPVADAAQPENSAFALILAKMLDINDEVVSARHLLNQVITPVHKATRDDNIVGEQIPIYEPIPEPSNFGQGHLIFQPKGKGIFYRSDDGVQAGLRMLTKSAEEVARNDLDIDQDRLDSVKLKRLEDELRAEFKKQKAKGIFKWINDFYADADLEQKSAIDSFIRDYDKLSESPLKALKHKIPYNPTMNYRNGGVEVESNNGGTAAPLCL